MFFLAGTLCFGGRLELPYSTYLGGNGSDYGYSVAVDISGVLYITGSTDSIDFPTVTPYQPARMGLMDVFVVKLSSSGSKLIYSTYLGGEYDDFGRGVSLEDNTAYVTGYTSSPDFPTANPYQASLAGSVDAFISRLSSTGSELIYSTYLGGGSWEEVGGISVENNTSYIIGTTLSGDFPTVIPCQAGFGGSQDAFISRLSSTGSELLYSSYLGGVITTLAVESRLRMSSLMLPAGRNRTISRP
jgi:hypothetical protein